MKVYITPKAFEPWIPDAAPLYEAAGVQFIPNPLPRPFSEDELLDRCADADALIVGIDPITKRVVDGLPHLKVVCKFGVGIDNIDVAACEQRGVAVRRTPGTNKVSVAEFSIALLMHMTKQIPYGLESIRSGGFDKRIGTELTGKTCGIVGYGDIGRELAPRLAGLMMDVLVYSPSLDMTAPIADRIRPAPLVDIYAQSDYVFLCAAITDATHGMINGDVFAQMKRGAYLINTARGALVNELALYIALTDGTLTAAASDVLVHEPPRGDEPLLTLPNFYLTPHMASFTRESSRNTALTATRNVLAVLTGQDG